MRLLALSFLLATLATSERIVLNARDSDADQGDCECFLTNGSHPTYFSEHMFFDFRSLSDYAGVPDPLADGEEAGDAPPTSDYFSGDEWTNTWQIQGWDNRVGNGDSLSNDATVLMVNSPNSIYIQGSNDDGTDSETFLTMRTKRMPDYQTAAEFQTTTSDYQFLSLRILARTIGSPGACTAMFTYRDSETLADVQEADIEILTSGPRNMIQYTNQPSYSEDGETFPEATSNATMPAGLRWTDWVVHRLDWTPEQSTWYVNGEETASIAFQTPRDTAQIHFNAWSNGNGWTGKMPVYDEAYLQIQWIEMVFNRTGDGGERKRAVLDTEAQGLGRRDSSDSGCNVVCSIDEVNAVGEEEVLWEGMAVAQGHDLRRVAVHLLLIISVVLYGWH